MSDSIRNVVIAGTGTMGSSIGLLFALHGYHVIMYNRHESSLEVCRKSLSSILDNLQNYQLVSKYEIMMAEDNILFSAHKKCFETADFVSENIPENIDIKHSFWKEVSEIVPKSSILTTNTSGLSITKIAEAVSENGRFLGMHWLNPPHLIPLVEVIAGKQTNDKTVESVYKLAEAINHVPVKVKKDVPGFLVNRMQFAILREAISLVEKGVASEEDIDKVFRYGLGMRYASIGPFLTADLGGLDIFGKIAQYLFPDLENRKDVPELLKQHVSHEDYGVKTGQGFYQYLENSAAAITGKRDSALAYISKGLYRNERTELKPKM